MERMTKSILIVGLNDKDAKKQIIPTDDALEIIYNTLSMFYEGATVSRVDGFYQGMHEASVKLEILNSDAEADSKLAEALKIALNQECVYYERAKVDAAFI